MSFTTRLSNGWALFKQSLETINKEKTLLVFPVFSTISLILILATFFGGTFYFDGDMLDSVFIQK